MVFIEPANLIALKVNLALNFGINDELKKIKVLLDR